MCLKNRNSIQNGEGIIVLFKVYKLKKKKIQNKSMWEHKLNFVQVKVPESSPWLCKMGNVGIY